MAGSVQITVAKSAGFCPGVKNAIDKVELARSRKKAIYTLGPLIRNKQVIETLTSTRPIPPPAKVFLVCYNGGKAARGRSE